MDIKNILVFFGILLNIYFAILIHFKSERSKANIIFESTVWAIVGWCISMLLYRTVALNDELWARFLYFFPTFIPTGFVLFGLYFPVKKTHKVWVYLIVLLNVLVALFTLIPRQVIQEVITPTYGEKIIRFGWAYYYIYLIYIPLFFLLAYLVLLKRYKESSSTIIRSQIITILVGLLIASTVGMITNLVLPTLGVFSANWAGQFFTFIWIASATYAIVKHGFLDVKVFTTQVFVVIILLVLLARLFTFTTLTNFFLDLGVFVVVLVFSVFLVKSVTGEIRQKEELTELNEKLKTLDAQKNEFISMAAHELRAPMTAIKGYISMILEGDVGNIPPKAREYLVDVNSINDRMVRLVNNMLNVSRIEEGRMSFQFEKDELSRVIRTVYSQFLPEANRKGLDYKVQIPSDIKDKVYADVDKLHEVVGNLISNAIKYTEKGHVYEIGRASCRERV